MVGFLLGPTSAEEEMDDCDTAGDQENSKRGMEGRWNDLRTDDFFLPFLWENNNPFISFLNKNLIFFILI